MRFDADGRIVTVARHYDSGNYLVVHRFLTDGTPDPAFSGDGTLAILMPGDTNVGGPAIQADGRIIVTGNYFGVDERGTMIMRLNEDGTLDPTFGSGGFVTEIDLNGRNVALLSDGRILVLAGLDDQMIVAVRYLPDGSRDDTFGTSGVATSPAIGTYPDSSGAALIGDRALVVPGTTDTTFDSDLLVARLALTDCGDGTTNFGEQCDDGNSKSGDGCSGGCRPEFCPPSPLPSASCLSAERTDLLVKASRPTKATVRFKWSHGGAIDPGDLGFPDIDTTVALCLYGWSGGVSTLAVGLTVTPGSLWVAGDSGSWVYADGTGSNDGIQRAELRPGVAGTTRAALRARGRYTLAPTAVSESLFISQDPVVTAQIISSDGLCLTSEFTAATTSRNAAGRFRGTAP